MSYVIIDLGTNNSLYMTEDDRGRTVPVTYETIEKAQAEINELLEDQQNEVMDGDRDPDECDDADSFAIIEYTPVAVVTPEV